jgi:hypothetical protein
MTNVTIEPLFLAISGLPARSVKARGGLVAELARHDEENLSMPRHPRQRSLRVRVMLAATVRPFARFVRFDLKTR